MRLTDEEERELTALIEAAQLVKLNLRAAEQDYTKRGCPPAELGPLTKMRNQVVSAMRAITDFGLKMVRRRCAHDFTRAGKCSLCDGDAGAVY